MLTAQEEERKKQILRDFQARLDLHLLGVNQRIMMKPRQDFNDIWRRVRNFVDTDHPDRDEIRKDIIKELLKIILQKIKHGKATSLVKLSEYIFPTDKIIHENISSLKSKKRWKNVLMLWWGAIVRRKLLDNEKSQQDVLRSISQWGKKQDRRQPTTPGDVKRKFGTIMNAIFKLSQQQNNFNGKIVPHIKYIYHPSKPVIRISVDVRKWKQDVEDDKKNKLEKLGFRETFGSMFYTVMSVPASFSQHDLQDLKQAWWWWSDAQWENFPPLFNHNQEVVPTPQTTHQQLPPDPQQTIQQPKRQMMEKPTQQSSQQQVNRLLHLLQRSTSSDQRQQAQVLFRQELPLLNVKEQQQQQHSRDLLQSALQKLDLKLVKNLVNNNPQILQKEKSPHGLKWVMVLFESIKDDDTNNEKELEKRHNIRVKLLQILNSRHVDLMQYYNCGAKSDKICSKTVDLLTKLLYENPRKDFTKLLFHLCSMTDVQKNILLLERVIKNTLSRMSSGNASSKKQLQSVLRSLVTTLNLLRKKMQGKLDPEVNTMRSDTHLSQQQLPPSMSSRRSSTKAPQSEEKRLQSALQGLDIQAVKHLVNNHAQLLQKKQNSQGIKWVMVLLKFLDKNDIRNKQTYNALFELLRFLNDKKVDVMGYYRCGVKLCSETIDYIIKLMLENPHKNDLNQILVNLCLITDLKKNIHCLENIGSKLQKIFNNPKTQTSMKEQYESVYESVINIVDHLSSQYNNT